LLKGLESRRLMSISVEQRMDRRHPDTLHRRPVADRPPVIDEGSAKIEENRIVQHRADLLVSGAIGRGACSRPPWPERHRFISHSWPPTVDRTLSLSGSWMPNLRRAIGWNSYRTASPH